MDTYYIYCARNSVNDKVYIGCTKRFRQRIWEHMRCYDREDCVFHRAIKEIGIDKFSFEIIDKAHTEEDAHRLEQKYIEEYDSFNNGYNSTIGGFSATPWNVRKIVCLDLDGNLVKTYDSAGQAERDGGYNNINVLLCCKGKLNTCKNHMFMYEDDYLEHGAKPYVKPVSSKRKAIIQCDLQGQFIEKFDSVSMAAEKLGIDRPQISSALTGKHKTAGGFIFVYENNFPIEDISCYVPRKKGRKIAQVDINTGEIINVYNRISEAGEALNVSYKVIQKAVDNDVRTAYGYKWISQ